ncbi:MAG: hypothetical protein AB7D51_06885 [Desulfovibrionaceae bacterium]
MFWDYFFSAVLLGVAACVFTILFVKLEHADEEARAGGRSLLPASLLEAEPALLWYLQPTRTTSR